MCSWSPNRSRIAAVGGVDVGRIARQRHPAERALALAEQRPHVRRDEPGIARTRPCPRARTPGRAARCRSRTPRRRRRRARGSPPTCATAHLADASEILVRIGPAQRVGLFEGQAGRDVAVQRVVGRGLVGHHVDFDPAADELGQHLGGVAGEADRQCPALARGPRPAARSASSRSAARSSRYRPRMRRSIRCRSTSTHSAVAVEHRDRERLGAAHAAQPGGHHQPPGQSPAEALARAAANVSYVPCRIPWLPM